VKGDFVTATLALRTNLSLNESEAQVYSFLYSRPKTLGATVDEMQEYLGLTKVTAGRALSALTTSGVVVQVTDAEGTVCTRFARNGSLQICYTLKNHGAYGRS
jgi:predicted transcriptional regulator